MSFSFGDYDLGAVRQLCLGEPLGGIHALDLYRLHLHEAVFAYLYHGLGVHDPAAPAIPAAVMLFHVFHMGVSAYEKGMHAIVSAVVVTAVVDAAASHDGHVAVIPYIEVIVDHLRQAALA